MNNAKKGLILFTSWIACLILTAFLFKYDMLGWGITFGIVSIVVTLFMGWFFLTHDPNKDYGGFDAT